ncbi:MAG: hypothetical protein HZC28_01150 [Spirochaetes bacterium]|nr:hypothetical protein [Spirochaetota bacterium]
MSNETPGKILVMGHRGWPVKYPENTLPSFKAAFDIGIDILEFDVMLSSDGVPVIMHDHTLDRTTTGTGPVSSRTFAELRTVDAGIKKNPSFAGIRIPSLDETLDLAMNYPDVILNIEIKDDSFDTAQIIMNALAQRHMEPRAVFTCFDAGILHLIKKTWPSAKVQGFPAKSLRNFIEGGNGTYAVMDYVGIYIKDANAALVTSFREKHIIPGVWCVDDAVTAAAAIELDIDIITSNDPDFLLRFLRERKLHN